MVLLISLVHVTMLEWLGMIRIGIVETIPHLHVAWLFIQSRTALLKVLLNSNIFFVAVFPANLVDLPHSN